LARQRTHRRCGLARMVTVFEARRRRARASSSKDDSGRMRDGRISQYPPVYLYFFKGAGHRHVPRAQEWNAAVKDVRMYFLAAWKRRSRIRRCPPRGLPTDVKLTEKAIKSACFFHRPAALTRPGGESPLAAAVLPFMCHGNHARNRACPLFRTILLIC